MHQRQDHSVGNTIDRQHHALMAQHCPVERAIVDDDLLGLIDERLYFRRRGMLADDSWAVACGIRQQQDLSLLRVAVRAG